MKESLRLSLNGSKGSDIASKAAKYLSTHLSQWRAAVILVLWLPSRSTLQMRDFLPSAAHVVSQALSLSREVICPLVFCK